MMPLHFNNDLTNTLSCTSPFHSPGGPFSPAVLAGSVADTAPLNVSTQVLAPGLCWVPWYNSSINPPREYARWFNATFRPSSSPHDAFFSYVEGGADILGPFAQLAAAAGQAAGLSFRVADDQSFNRPPLSNYGNLPQFWYEHRHDPAYMVSGEPFPDDCCWVSAALCRNASSSFAREHGCNDVLLGAMDWAHPEVLAEREALIGEAVRLYPQLATLELDFMRTAHLFNTSRTSEAQRAALVGGMLRRLKALLPPPPRGRLAVRVPPEPRVLRELGLDLASLAADGTLDYVQGGAGFWSFLASDSGFAALRAQLPRATPLLFEVTSMRRPGRPAGNCSTPGHDRMTREMLTTTALDAYAHGADGMSAFNFQYYRPFADTACTFAGDEPFHEPLFGTLAKLGDREWLGPTQAAHTGATTRRAWSRRPRPGA